ncbi:MAG: TolC family protein [Planctomycetales bacterium]|nr:TolC family protein [Planctomycetales bacterium]
MRSCAALVLWLSVIPGNLSISSDPLPVAFPVNELQPLDTAQLVNVPANASSTASSMLASYFERASHAQSFSQNQGPNPAAIPTDFVPWWEPIALRPTQTSTMFIELNGLLESALDHSPFVRSIAAQPMVNDTIMVEEGAAFDWTRFFEASYSDANDPVGSDLTTGNADDRFKDKNYRSGTGVRRTNSYGGQVEIAQRYGTQRNNSRFLNPNPQATARLELNYTHPIMRGSGQAYNRSRIVLADIARNLSRDEFAEQVQEHLLQVTIAYWDLYRTRTRYIQRQALLRAAELIHDKLIGREQVDSLHRQVLRAKAAVARRKSEIARAATEIENTEAQLRVLVNSPSLVQTDELTPLVVPFTSAVSLSVPDCLTTALANRRDVSQAIRNIQSTSVRLGIARNDMLPKLDLLLSSYVAGLDSGYKTFSAWNRQFIDGRPGFSVGILWELPSGNRAARARQQRQEWEWRKSTSQFANTVETSMTEVEIAAREVVTTFQEMLGKYQAMLAASTETAFLSDRYELLPGISDSAPLLLEDLLDAQERQSDEEAAYVEAQVNYSISLVRLRQAMGTLLLAGPDCNPVTVDQTHGSTQSFSSSREHVLTPEEFPSLEPVEPWTVPAPSSNAPYSARPFNTVQPNEGWSNGQVAVPDFSSSGFASIPEQVFAPALTGN